MAYTKINWQNSPSAETPINADNLNHMDDQIAENEQKISELETEVDDLGDGKVSKSGDTMSGNLQVSGSGEHYVKVVNSDKECGVYLDTNSAGTHGIYSNGYYNGSQFVSSGKWLLHRDSDNKTYINNSIEVPNSTGKVALKEDVVSKTGDTITGRLNISQSNNDAPLYVKGDADGAFIGYQTVDGTTKGWIGVKSDSKPYFFDNSAKRIALLSDIPNTFGNYSVSVNKNGASKTLTVASSTRAILFTLSGHPDNCALKYISSNSSGDITVIDMINASKISVIANNNGTITVTNTEPNNNVSCAFTIITGNVTE